MEQTKPALIPPKPEFNWSRWLSSGEEVKLECGLGQHYLQTGFIFSLSIGIVLSILIVGIFIIIWALVYWKFYLPRAFRFALTDRRVLVHRGLLNTSLISIDYKKITDVQLKEDFIEKHLFSTGTILINTAGTTYHEVIIDKLADAVEFKQQLESLRQQQTNFGIQIN